MGLGRKVQKRQDILRATKGKLAAAAVKPQNMGWWQGSIVPLPQVGLLTTGDHDRPYPGAEIGPCMGMLSGAWFTFPRRPQRAGD
jgi:hypothetical protein